MKELNDALMNVYLDWINNYLTVAKMAEDYGFDREFMGACIEEGKKIHEDRTRVCKPEL